MRLMQEEFPDGEVAFYAINYLEPESVVRDYLSDTGLTAPVLLDSPVGTSPGCYVIPGGDQSLTEHFQLRVGDPSNDPPFPLQVVIGADGRFAYLSRNHEPEALLSVLRALVASGP